MTEDVEKDRQRAEVFDALGHPARITVLKALSEGPLGFADLKKRLNIESSGHLQHHLSKLGNLIKVDENGRYCLSEYGKDALFAVQTVENVREPRIKELSGERLSKATARLLLALALLLLVAFVWLQIASMNNPNFLLLMFSSFIFLSVATFLTLRTFSGSAEKRLCLAVAIVLIVSTLLVANSLAQFPRGGNWNYIPVTPKSFVLSIENKGSGYAYYYGGYSQIIHSAGYPVTLVEARTHYDRVLTINVSNSVNLQGTIYLFLIFKPYNEMTYAFFQRPLTFNESSSFAYYEVDLWLEWGSSRTTRTRFEGYELEFTVRLDLQGSEAGPRYLNFTVDTTFLKIYVDDFMVDSSFQNGLSITLSGIFTGINAYIPGKYLLTSFTKSRLKKNNYSL